MEKKWARDKGIRNGNFGAYGGTKQSWFIDFKSGITWLTDRGFVWEIARDGRT